MPNPGHNGRRSERRTGEDDHATVILVLAARTGVPLSVAVVDRGDKVLAGRAQGVAVDGRVVARGERGSGSEEPVVGGDRGARAGGAEDCLDVGGEGGGEVPFVLNGGGGGEHCCGRSRNEESGRGGSGGRCGVETAGKERKFLRSFVVSIVVLRREKCVVCEAIDKFLIVRLLARRCASLVAQ